MALVIIILGVVAAVVFCVKLPFNGKKSVYQLRLRVTHTGVTNPVNDDNNVTSDSENATTEDHNTTDDASNPVNDNNNETNVNTTNCSESPEVPEVHQALDQPKSEPAPIEGIHSLKFY